MERQCAILSERNTEVNREADTPLRGGVDQKIAVSSNSAHDVSYIGCLYLMRPAGSNEKYKNMYKSPTVFVETWKEQPAGHVHQEPPSVVSSAMQCEAAN